MKWQTLAPELIYEILSQYRADFKEFKLSVTELYSFPWHLGHICGAWRDVFVSSPQFWNILEISVDFPLEWCKPQMSRECVLEIARISMVRSRNSPISFKLSITSYSRASPAEIIMSRQIIEILVANSARWRDAYIFVSADEMSTIYAAKNRMPLLRSIGLGLAERVVDNKTNIRSNNAAKLYSDFLVDATQLTRIAFDCDSPFWKINWSLITDIYFYSTPPLSQLLAHLSQMSSLMKLVFRYGPGRDKTSKDGIVPITLPHLKIIYSPVSALLPMVETPALQELHIKNDISMIEDENALKDPISRYFRSICHISKLEIDAYDWEDAVLIIEHMPRVDHLTLFSESLVYLIQILGLREYPQLGFLKTVTFMLLAGEEERDNLLFTVSHWKRGTGKNRGIGPFHDLTEMSFKMLDDYPQEFADGLKLHLEAQGIRCTISEQVEEQLSSVFFPKFDVL